MQFRLLSFYVIHIHFHILFMLSSLHSFSWFPLVNILLQSLQQTDLFFISFVTNVIGYLSHGETILNSLRRPTWTLPKKSQAGPGKSVSKKSGLSQILLKKSQTAPSFIFLKLKKKLEPDPTKKISSWPAAGTRKISSKIWENLLNHQLAQGNFHKKSQTKSYLNHYRKVF